MIIFISILMSIFSFCAGVYWISMSLLHSNNDLFFYYLRKRNLKRMKLGKAELVAARLHPDMCQCKICHHFYSEMETLIESRRNVVSFFRGGL